ncbi:hypothetical protein [Staphylospora marina]|uniref:hypothetical protein n=1 Tax=Staphylospora marina TaxID=2490858 RepID=UPI001F151AAA|nr:hypothetical protein [Staphylospora marina]
MQLKDALFNWLQIRIVWDARPSDRSARDTVLFFEDLLRDVHSVTDPEKQADGSDYVVRYRREGKEEEARFPRDEADRLLKDIQAEPRYNQCFEE